MGIVKNIDVKAGDLKTLKTLLGSYLSGATVWAFGSRAKFTSSPASDLDLVAFLQPGQAGRLADLKDALAESDLPFKVDILDWNIIPENFKEQIENEYAIIQDANAIKITIPNDWKTYKLGDLCLKITSGGTPPTNINEYYGGTIPWLKTQEVNFNRIYNTETKITESGLKNSSAKWIPENSVIIAMYGATAGKMAINKIPLTTNQACCNLIIDSSKANYSFIYYNLASRFTEIAGMATGGAQQNLNAGMIRDLDITLPPLPTQHRIASILSSLDDAIELNQQTNKTLEDIAKAVFKEMCLPKGDELPEGWRVGKLGEVVTHSKESINPSQYPDVDFFHYSIPAYDNGNNPSIEKGNTILSNKFKVKSNSILVSKLNPRFPRTWAIGEVEEERSICSTEFQVLTPRKIYYYSFALILFYQNSIIEIMKGGATGTSGSHQRIRPQDILDMTIAIPDDLTLKKYHELVSSFIKEIDLNKQENQTLAALRDLLLPKLMKGEIEIKMN